MRFELCEMHEILLYKTKLITKFGSFWSEIRNEIWSISNEIQAEAKWWVRDRYCPGTFFSSFCAPYYLVAFGDLGSGIYTSCMPLLGVAIEPIFKIRVCYSNKCQVRWRECWVLDLYLLLKCWHITHTPEGQNSRASRLKYRTIPPIYNNIALFNSQLYRIAVVPRSARPRYGTMTCSPQRRDRRSGDLCLQWNLSHEQFPLQRGV